MWLDSQPEDVPVQCKKHPRYHGNARKSDNITKRFLPFVDRNSVSNGHKEGSSGKTFYFDANSLKFVKKILNLNTSISIVSC